MANFEQQAGSRLHAIREAMQEAGRLIEFERWLDRMCYSKGEGKSAVHERIIREAAAGLYAGLSVAVDPPWADWDR